MNIERQASGSGRWVRIAVRLGVFVVLVAALQLNSVTIRSRLLVLLIIAAVFVLAYSWTSRRWLRRVIVALGILILLPIGTVFLLSDVHVSATAPSPHGGVVAEVREFHTMPDYNFTVCLKTEGRWGTSHFNCVFRSPDEGPPNTQRLLWSRDGRYLLLLTTRKDSTMALEEARLASGEYLYMLLDTKSNVVRVNVRGYHDPRPFTVEDLAGIDFGESFSLDTPSRPPAAH